MPRDRMQKTALLLLLIVISGVFVVMIRQFLMTILLAAIVSGLIYPLYARFTRWFGERRRLAAVVTLLLVLFLIVGPLLGFLGVLASQAFKISETAGPWIQKQIEQPDLLAERIKNLPFASWLEPYREQILTKLGELTGAIGNFLVHRLSDATRGTVSFLFQFFILVYSLYFFLLDGPRILRKMLYYLPLEHADEMRMVDKFVSVSKATIKGTLVIGIVQGVLGGLALAVAGVQGSVFWGTIMTVLSIIPGIGTALVWVPAAVYFFATGAILKAVLLTLFCALVVGSVDNFLRPWLVGRDVKMHDLLILFSTIGGVLLFGVLGFIIGPILAALFVTIWEIYGLVFADLLPPGPGPGEEN